MLIILIFLLGQIPAQGGIDSSLIVFMGSSVARGAGADNDHGYAYQLQRGMEKKHLKDNTQLDWRFKNISIGGNTTVHLLERWQRDLLPLRPRFVVFGLSLANEGIR